MLLELIAGQRQHLNAWLVEAIPPRDGIYRVLVLSDTTYPSWLGTLISTAATFEPNIRAKFDVLGRGNVPEGVRFFHARKSETLAVLAEYFASEPRPSLVVVDEMGPPIPWMNAVIGAAAKYCIDQGIPVVGPAISELAADLRGILLGTEGYDTRLWLGSDSSVSWQVVPAETMVADLSAEMLAKAQIDFSNLGDDAFQQIVPLGEGRPFIRWFRNRASFKTSPP